MFLHGLNYVVGGCDENDVAISSCIKLDTVNSKVVDVKNLTEARLIPACAVFEGRVITSGGRQDVNADLHTNTVEAYHHVSNT